MLTNFAVATLKVLSVFVCAMYAYMIMGAVRKEYKQSGKFKKSNWLGIVIIPIIIFMTISTINNG